jgi:hypothetical protein
LVRALKVRVVVAGFGSVENLISAVNFGPATLDGDGATVGAVVTGGCAPEVAGSGVAVTTITCGEAVGAESAALGAVQAKSAAKSAQKMIPNRRNIKVTSVIEKSARIIA